MSELRSLSGVIHTALHILQTTWGNGGPRSQGPMATQGKDKDQSLNFPTRMGGFPPPPPRLRRSQGGPGARLQSSLSLWDPNVQGQPPVTPVAWE